MKVYNYFRTFDSSIGRYTQSGPIGMAGGLITYAYVAGNPLAFYDPLGLDSLSAGFSGSFFVGGAGGNATGSVGFDTSGNVCASVTVCGRFGGGTSVSGRIVGSYGTGDFCPGDTVSGGFFAGGGLGPFGSVSTRTDVNLDTTVTVRGGVGAGASGGGQVCLTHTVCL